MVRSTWCGCLNAGDLWAGVEGMSMDGDDGELE